MTRRLFRPRDWRLFWISKAAPFRPDPPDTESSPVAPYEYLHNRRGDPSEHEPIAARPRSRCIRRLARRCTCRLDRRLAPRPADDVRCPEQSPPPGNARRVRRQGILGAWCVIHTMRASEMIGIEQHGSADLSVCEAVSTRRWVIRDH